MQPPCPALTKSDIKIINLEVISGIFHFVFANIIEAWYDEINVINLIYLFFRQSEKKIYNYN